MKVRTVADVLANRFGVEHGPALVPSERRSAASTRLRRPTTTRPRSARTRRSCARRPPDRAPHAHRRRPAAGGPPTRSPTSSGGAAHARASRSTTSACPTRSLRSSRTRSTTLLRAASTSGSPTTSTTPHRRVPPPPQHVPGAPRVAPLPDRGDPGRPDLMHHKYVIRDGAALWTGSTNWTADSWTREENVIVTVDSPDLAAAYREDFEQLWTKRDVEKSGKVDTAPLDVAGRRRAWFCPGRGEKLAHRIAKAIGTREAPHPHRLAGDQLRPDPRHARAGRRRRQGRPRRRRRPRPRSTRSSHQWHQTATRTWKEPLLRTALSARAVLGQALDPVRARARCTTTCTRR